MTDTLAPNRIHSLPVVVRYHVPASSHSFTTLFSSPQQVYVHPNPVGVCQDDCDESWGSIYLKTVVQGVLMASPELHPCNQPTDLSLYILDPRETFMRRSRSSHSRPRGSSPASMPSSPLCHDAQSEVWTGKGLMSWALDEPGVGKNLITGRLLRSRAFASASKAHAHMSPMEALMATDQAQEAWGIEVSLGLKSGATSSSGFTAPVSMPVASYDQPKRPSVASLQRPSHASSSSSSASLPPRVTPSLKALPPRPASMPQSAPRPLSPSRIGSNTPLPKQEPPRKRSTGRKKKTDTRSTTPVPTKPTDARGRTPASSSDAEFPDDVPATLYSDPASLTKEQAERLLESPAFLSMLSKLTGQPIAEPDKKRPREDEKDDANKRAKTSAVACKTEACDAAPALKCWNCGRTKSAVWRMKVMDDGKQVRVCNACGLYWNKMRTMRPPTLWQGVDEEVRTNKKKDEVEEKPASRIDQPSSPASSTGSGGFKRTLSAVVNQDAKRIAAMRHTKQPGSQLRHSFKPSPMTSPPRASGSETRSVRNAQWNNNTTIAPASSPGGWHRPMHSGPAPPTSDNFNPVPSSPKRAPMAAIPEESPNTAIRRILGTDTAMQSLDLPLSDDGGQHELNNTTFDWNTDLSAFFDVEGFSMSHNGAVLNNPNIKSEGTEAEDEVLSQLFNRTSSGILESSPAPFDFSQLPPSSPPIMSDLPHSALLLSSPDLSPMDRISPAKSTGKSSFTPGSSAFTPRPSPLGEIKGFDNNQALEELWRMTEMTQNNTMASSAAEAENLVGGAYQNQAMSSHDLFAMFDKNFTSV